jgi:predicted MFS family arabinose efflux permease
VPRVFHGWYVVACAFLIAVWGWGLGFYGLGVYLVGLRDLHGWSASTISGAITMYYLVGAALIALVGRVMTRFGPRRTVLTGISAMALAVVSLTFITAPWQLYAAFLVMTVGWAAMSAATVNLLIAPWFEGRRGLALSLAFTGASCGGVVVGPGLLWLIDALGFETGVRVAVAVMLLVLLPIVTLVLRRRPALPDIERERLAAADPARAARPAPFPWTISIPFAAGLAAQVGFLTHQVAFLTPLVGSASAGLCLSLTALAAILGRFLLGGFVDRIDARAAAFANFIPQVIGLTVLVWLQSEPALYAGSVLFGLGVGNMVSLPGLLVQREFRPEQFAGVVSLVTATNQVAFAFAPTVMAMLRDATGTYTTALGVCVALDVLGAIVVLAPRARRRAPAPTEETPAMLQLRPNCECCDRDLPPDSREAFICSFECTFCRRCTEEVLGGRCPNCGGELVRRPARPAEKMSRFPASAQRVFKPEGCRRVAETAGGRS